MDEKPRRRWFRFRLSTILILIGVLAWFMATRPRVHVGPWWGSNQPPGLLLQFNAGIVNDLGGMTGYYIELMLPTGVVWPALAIAAFLAWKAGWSVVERRRARARIE